MSNVALVFEGPGGTSVMQTVTRFKLATLLKRWFAMLAPGRPLPEWPTSLETRTYNFGTDQAYRTAEGDGILVADRCFGALPGDGVETIWTVTVRDEMSLVVEQQLDSIQDTFVFRLSASADTIDIATDALLQVAAAEGLVFVRRDE
jgi:hypothetical protein